MMPGVSGLTPWAILCRLFEAIYTSPERDRAIFGDVADGTRHFDEPALYVLLERVESTGPEETPRSPAHVSRETLIDESSVRRGTPVLVRAVFVASEPIRLLNRVRFSRPVYGCILSNPGDGEPLQAVTLEPPEGLRLGDRVEVAGYYLKYRRDEPTAVPQQGPADDVLVPIIVARRLIRQGGAGPATTDTDRPEWIVVVVVALAVIYYLVRRWASRRRDHPMGRLVRPGAKPRPERRDPPVDLDALSRSPTPPQGRDEASE